MKRQDIVFLVALSIVVFMLVKWLLGALFGLVSFLFPFALLVILGVVAYRYLKNKGLV